MLFAALASRYDLLVVLSLPDSVRDASLVSGYSSISEYEADSSASEESSAKRAELNRVPVLRFQIMLLINELLFTVCSTICLVTSRKISLISDLEFSFLPFVSIFQCLSNVPE